MQTPPLQGSLPVHQPLRKQIAGLDALRLLAAVLVLGLHLFVTSWLPSRNGGASPTQAFAFLRPIFCYGWIGVEIFFVISGFVIAYSAQGVSARRFAQYRFFRLWPVCVLCALVAAFSTEWVFHWTHVAIWKSFFETVVFTPGAPGVDYVDEPFWTLPVEVSFYSLVYLLIAFRRLHLLPRVAAALGVASTLYWCLISADPYWSGHVWLTVHKALQRLSFYPCTLLLHGCFFATGVLLWDAMLRRTTPRRLAAFGVCLTGGVLETWFHARTSSAYLQVVFSGASAVAIWLAAVAAIWASVRWNVRLHTRLGLRGVGLLRAMGLITYPLYLLHNRLGFALTMQLHGTLGWWPAMLVALLTVLFAACTLALIVDPAIQKRLKRFTLHSKAGVAQPLASPGATSTTLPLQDSTR